MTLYFSNIVSRLCLCVCFILLLTGCYKNPKEVSSLENQNNGTIKEHNDNYVINCFDDEFELVFYKKNGDVLFSKSYTKEPMITQIKDGLYRINNSSGSNSNYTFFVDNNLEMYQTLILTCYILMKNCLFIWKTEWFS